jgi:hypothetical protein
VVTAGDDVRVEEMFDDLARRLLDEDAGLERSRMFRSVGLRTAGKFFAVVVKGELVVKLPAERVDELVAGDAGRRFDPGHGRLMREWVCLRPVDESACAAYVDEARNFVAAQGRC